MSCIWDNNYRNAAYSFTMNDLPRRILYKKFNRTLRGVLQENLKAIQARDRALEKRCSQLEQKKKQHILDAEGNDSEIMMRDNLLKEHAQKVT